MNNSMKPCNYLRLVRFLHHSPFSQLTAFNYQPHITKTADPSSHPRTNVSCFHVKTFRNNNM